MSWDEATLNSAEIKPVALAIIELHFSERISRSVGQSVSQSAGRQVGGQAGGQPANHSRILLNFGDHLQYYYTL